MYNSIAHRPRLVSRPIEPASAALMREVQPTGDMAHPKKSATQQRKKMPRISEGLLDIRVSLLWV
ncbi:MAG: hypothetical protein L0228_03095, partial [Planctomycetes bacterium]|nr:hypothetical protein [Planctomycetota bacterium]